MPKGVYPKTAEHIAKVAKAITKHGMCNTRTYTSWSQMRQRCYNPYTINFKYYGGRGVSVCERWRDIKNGFINFYKDMGDRPEGKSLDRINNKGNYTPKNCKWSTPQEQANNRRKKNEATKI